MGRAGRPPKSAAKDTTLALRHNALRSAGLDRWSADGPAAQALRKEGLLAEDYEIKITAVDDQYYRWSAGQRSGIARSASAASLEATEAAREESQLYSQQIAEREKLYSKRRDLLEGLQLPGQIRSMETDIISDPRIENLHRQELAGGYTVLTYQIDRKHRRSPYPVIATEGVPQKESGYLVFFHGEIMPLGDRGGVPIEQPRGMWLGSRRQKRLRLQAEKEIAAYNEKEEYLRTKAPEHILNQEGMSLYNYPDEQ